MTTKCEAIDCTKDAEGVFRTYEPDDSVWEWDLCAEHAKEAAEFYPETCEWMP